MTRCCWQDFDGPRQNGPTGEGVGEAISIYCTLIFRGERYLCVGNGLGKALSSDCNAAPLDLKAAWITAQNFGNLYHRSSVGPGITFAGGGFCFP